ncbi:MAG: repressor [Deltaproteobacteria bacterium RIFCSPLOWO2_02_FULL_53_8]|nr:MAG: repressor [Deltaproteobacteria bacterium RIFCSPLOWO2_02_FULL_53_8]
MPTKHIDDETWRKVEKEAVKATIATKKSIKETEMLKWLILKGLEEITETDFQKIANAKK